jgi:Zn-dependent protease with chaperone function
MGEHSAVKSARNGGDTGVLFACLGIIFGGLFAVFMLLLLIAALAQQEIDAEGGVLDIIFQAVGYFVFMGAILLFTLLTIRMMRQNFLANMLHVEYSDYAWLREWSNMVASELNMPRVEIFITQDPYINAFAIGFAKPYNIVLNSGSIRYLTNDELKAIVIHEMGHVKYHHTQISAYLSAVRGLPFVGELTSWILDFWTRRTELTADRLAVYYLRDPDLVKRSLIKVHVGPDVAKGFNDITQKWQEHHSFNTFNAFTQTFSSHPFLVRRLRHIDMHAARIQPRK